MSVVDACCPLPAIAVTVTGPPSRPDAVKSPFASIVPAFATSSDHCTCTGLPASFAVNCSVTPGALTSSVGFDGVMTSCDEDASPPPRVPIERSVAAAVDVAARRRAVRVAPAPFGDPRRRREHSQQGKGPGDASHLRASVRRLRGLEAESRELRSRHQRG